MLGVSTELGVALWANAEDVFERLDEPIMLTSPPYPLATPRAYGNVPLARYVEWIVDMLEPLAKRLRQGGTMAMNISNDISNQEVQHDQRFGSDWSSLCVMSWRCSSGTNSSGITHPKLQDPFNGRHALNNNSMSRGSRCTSSPTTPIAVWPQTAACCKPIPPNRSN